MEKRMQPPKIPTEADGFRLINETGLELTEEEMLVIVNMFYRYKTDKNTVLFNVKGRDTNGDLDMELFLVDPVDVDKEQNTPSPKTLQ
jgi:hypothetical protein